MANEEVVRCPRRGAECKPSVAFCDCGQQLLLQNYPHPPEVRPPTAVSGSTQQQAAGRRDGFAIAGMVLGICSIAIPILGPLALPCSLVGLPMSLIGLKSRNRGMAIAGVVCSAVGLLVLIFAIFAGFLMLSIFRDPFFRGDIIK